LETWTIWE